MPRRRLKRKIADAKAKIALARCGAKLQLEDASEGGDEPVAKWVQVASANIYEGYMGGLAPFEFTREHFDQMRNNLRAHPSFVADENGVGKERVLPWDFNHASEQDATDGSLPFTGAPAIGWTWDLEVRTGAEGRAELWALTEFLEPARTYVKEGKYQWASVAVTFDAIDPVSGANVGAYVTSIAATNTPFIEGMDKLAASRKVENRGYFYDAARTVEDAIRDFKELLGLPETTGIAELKTEFGKLREFSDGTPPPGVDMDDIMGDLRTILGMPVLASAGEVLDSAEEMVQRLEDDAAAGTPGTTTATKESDDMKDLLKILASLLGTRENDDAVRAGVEDLVALRDGVVALTGARDSAGAKAILATATESHDAGVTAIEKLGVLFNALEAEDVEGSIAKITDLVTKAGELTEVMPELEQLRKVKEDTETKQAEADVEEVMNSNKLPANMKPALVLFRKTDPEKFAETYPKADKPQAAANATLTNPLVATAGGAQLGVAPDGSQVTLSTGDDAGDMIDLDAYKGNPTQRALKHLTAAREGFTKLSWDEQCTAAKSLLGKPGTKFSPGIL